MGAVATTSSFFLSMACEYPNWGRRKTSAPPKKLLCGALFGFSELS
jgi:hypothetical protein